MRRSRGETDAEQPSWSTREQWRKQWVAQLELPVYVLHGSNKPGCRRRRETAARCGLTLTEGEVKNGDETWAALRGSCTPHLLCCAEARPWSQ